MPQALNIKTFSVDGATWTELTAAHDADDIEVLNSGTVQAKVRSASGDATTEYTLEAGETLKLPLQRWLKAQSLQPLVRAGERVAYFQMASGTHSLTAFYRRA